MNATILDHNSHEGSFLLDIYIYIYVCVYRNQYPAEIQLGDQLGNVPGSRSSRVIDSFPLLAGRAGHGGTRPSVMYTMLTVGIKKGGKALIRLTAGTRTHSHTKKTGSDSKVTVMIRDTLSDHIHTHTKRVKERMGNKKIPLLW